MERWKESSKLYENVLACYYEVEYQFDNHLAVLSPSHHRLCPLVTKVIVVVETLAEYFVEIQAHISLSSFLNYLRLKLRFSKLLMAQASTYSYHLISRLID